MNSIQNAKQVPGYPDYFVTPEGKMFSTRVSQHPKPMKLTENKGYLYVNITNNQGRLRTAVHRLVAITYLDKPAGHDVVNHLDGNKSNNNVANLEWTTHRGNAKHWHAHVKRQRVVPVNSNDLQKKVDFLTQAFNMLKGQPEVFAKVFAALELR